MSLDPARRFSDVRELGATLLEWASEPARHRYTAHFTSAPPAPIDPQLSMAIDTNTRESTIPPPAAPTDSTVLENNPTKQETRQLGTAELLVAASEVAELPITSPLRRPATLIVGGAAALVLATVITLALHRPKPAPMPPAPPADLLAPRPTPSAAPALPPLAPVAPAQPVAPPVSSSAPPAAPPPEPAAPSSAPTTTKRPIHHRKKSSPPVDEKGFPLPS